MRCRARWLAMEGDLYYFEALDSPGPGGRVEWGISFRGHLIGNMSSPQSESFKGFERRAVKHVRELLQPRLVEVKREG
jgi:hypothetical protein